MPSTHHHPNPALNRVIQWGALVVFGIMIVSVFGQVYIALTVPLAGMMIVAAVFTALLALPVLMLTTMLPPVTVGPDGVTLHPVIWRDITFGWDAVTTVKPHPLLPPPDGEMGRRLLVGRRKYRPAAGVMLIVPSLPFYYRVNGVFCGEGLTPTVSFTNRSHADYDKLARKIDIYFHDTHPAPRVPAE